MICDQLLLSCHEGQLQRTDINELKPLCQLVLQVLKYVPNKKFNLHFHGQQIWVKLLPGSTPARQWLSLAPEAASCVNNCTLPNEHNSSPQKILHQCKHGRNFHEHLKYIHGHLKQITSYIKKNTCAYQSTLHIHSLTAPRTLLEPTSWSNTGSRKTMTDTNKANYQRPHREVHVPLILV